MNSSTPTWTGSQDEALGVPMGATQFFVDDTAIKVRLNELNQLFDPLDPDPLHERDISRDIQDYIVQSLVKLCGRRARAMVICLDQPSESASEQAAIKAIQVFFARRAERRRWELRQLFRQGFVSLAIGLGFLMAFWGLAQLASLWLGENPSGFLLRQSLIIGGWVAMWRPLEIFLYDWWPLVGQRRLDEQLSQIEVQIVPSLRKIEETPS